MEYIVIDGKRYTSEEVQDLFLNEDDGDISDAPTINSEHDSDDEYCIQNEECVNSNAATED